jgi:hypothetical protein
MSGAVFGHAAEKGKSFYAFYKESAFEAWR